MSNDKLMTGIFEHSPYSQIVPQTLTTILYYTCIHQIMCRVYLVSTYTQEFIFS